MTWEASPDAQADAPAVTELPGKTQAAVAAAVSVFGETVLPKLQGGGEPEDQMRAPLEGLLQAVAADLGLKVTSVGEHSLADIRVRPDYAIEVDGALVGYIEVKAPGVGVDPTKWGVKSHNRLQWEKLAGLPNVLYTDGNTWALYRKGVRDGEIARLKGDVRRSGKALTTDGSGLPSLLDAFLRWEPIAPRTLTKLVNSVAGLCRLLRDEVAEAIKQEEHTGGPFTSLASDWRELLFPDADDDEFADGYAQTITFALLLARVERIDFTGQPISEIARQLGKGHSLMGRALAVLTDEGLGKLTRTIDTMLRVVGAVDWGKFEPDPDLELKIKNAHRPKKRQDPYLHLYEHFLEVYDPVLRKKTGSYYTPVDVVDGMIRLVDGLLKDRLGQPFGFASDDVVVVDPAMGTGTYLLNVIEHAAEVIAAEEGDGAVPARLRRMAERVIGFEKQAGPYAVAEMRGYEALRRHKAEPPKDGLRLYVADTLDNPNAAEANLLSLYEPIAKSRRAANRVKREEPVLVVIGNPPYKNYAGGQGGWIESGNPKAGEPSPMDAFRAEGNGSREYVLSNLYVYFWRWATWKVFDHHPDAPAGVVAFITPSSFTTGLGFTGMREYLRRSADEGWIIDLTPEGFQPEVNTRVFTGVQQPLCIAIFARYGKGDSDTPALVHHTSIAGTQRAKFDSLGDLTLNQPVWEQCPTDWQARFSPQQGGDWLSFPAFEDLLPWRTQGITPGRTWVYAPDAQVLRERWDRLVREADPEKKSALFRESRDSHLDRLVPPLPGHDRKTEPFRAETGPCPARERVAFRAFDRQWYIPDARLSEAPRAELWRVAGERQVFVSEQHTQPKTSGPALIFSALVPDKHHFKGSQSGLVSPLFRDGAGTPNMPIGLLDLLAARLGTTVTPEDVLAYVAGTLSHPGYTARFAEELETPEARVPLTASFDLYEDAVKLGREVVWLHTYGERYAAPSADRPSGPPRLPAERRPKVVVAIPDDEEGMPEALDYDADTQTLKVGDGRVSPVSPEAYDYDVGGSNVLKKWFGYRKKRTAGKRTSPLDHMQATRWSPDTTTDLLNLLQVLQRLVDLEPAQADLLGRIVASPQITVRELEAAGVLPVPADLKRPVRADAAPEHAQQTLL